MRELHVYLLLKKCSQWRDCCLASAAAEERGSFRQAEEFVSKIWRSTFRFESMKCPVAPMPALLDEHVQPAEVLRRGVHHRLPVFEFRHVGGDRAHQTADATRFIREFFKKLFRSLAAMTRQPCRGGFQRSGARPMPCEAPVTRTRSPVRSRRAIVV